jgi:hypothetical protein
MRGRSDAANARMPPCAVITSGKIVAMRRRIHLAGEAMGTDRGIPDANDLFRVACGVIRGVDQ